MTSTGSPSSTPWAFEKKAIELHIKADPQLNLVHNTPHTLFLCIYHLRDLSSFQELQGERDGLHMLLQCRAFDPTVVAAQRFVIQPGQEIYQALDRPEGAKYLNITAGYYHMRKEDMNCSYRIPLQLRREGAKVVQEPEKLHVDLYLSPQDIQKVQD